MIDTSFCGTADGLLVTQRYREFGNLHIGDQRRGGQSFEPLQGTGGKPCYRHSNCQRVGEEYNSNDP
jgi:hypothetical protein